MCPLSEGCDAATFGKSRLLNPYTVGTYEASEWDKGYFMMVGDRDASDPDPDDACAN